MNSSHPLDGAFERVKRAGEHLTDLKARIEQWRQAQGNFAILQEHPTIPEKMIAGLTEIVPMSLRVAILVGEICYNLRTSLDYLVFELALFDSEQAQNGTQFPIEDKPKGFAFRKKGGWLNGLNSAHIAAVEGLQPYKGCNWTKALRNISNPDKHRQIVAFQSNMSLQIAVAGSDPPDAAFHAAPGIKTRTMHPHLGQEVDVKLNLASEIQLSDGTPIIETLEIIKLKVSETLDAFKPEFR